MTDSAPAPLRDRPRGFRGLRAEAARASWTASAARLGSVSIAAALFLSLTGAFGMDPVPLWKRLSYWTGLLLLGSALSLGWQAWMAQRTARPLLLRSAGLAAGLTVLMTPVVFVATRLLFGGGWDTRELASFVGPVFIVCAAMTVLNVLTLRAREARASGEAAAVTRPPPPPPPAAARFRERLPHRLRAADIYAVEAEDHYLRVHTDRGSDLLLMRLADALEELAPIEGARTHRSWWVARAAVAEARRGDGRATLVLRDGREAPVSRSYAPALREAGWF